MTQAAPTLMRRIRGMMFKMPLMITCEEFDDFILAYLEDTLSAREKFVFELHLKVCRDCREYLAAYRASLELARKCGKEPDEALPPVPDDLVQAVMEARGR
ncbi:anti-sigma factor family protein [Hoeflea poritis]|uniref:Zf-HC2 domain-containing protein n=1 Tax=Hoeflea poritis TaxID=2993659 RepID=A0ABT4VP19_9HYPH|nr:zf-HC2 domain-containing protein [Hoeflea poritis]MDA4846460.1 zf-HC2 domain-containing protein [Hoeflea poritis]